MRLVLRDQRPTAGVVAVIFIFMSISAVLLLFFQAVSIFADRIGRFDGFLWLLGTVVFIGLGVGFVLLGVMAALHFLVGTTCVLDREAEEISVERVEWFRAREERHSIYGISRIEVEANPEVHAFGVFIVLRSNQRIPVASFHDQDEDAMRALVERMRAFLQQVR
ncbi:MAG: hypothetical protein ACOCYT_03840 [Chloroflexota bacterium]